MDEARIKAAQRGSKFFEGKNCIHGHGTTRYVMSGCCKVCASEKAKASYRKIKAKLVSAKGGG